MTALDMLDALEEFNREQEQHQAPRLVIVIGLHFGAAFIGYAGSKDRHDYSALGETVNTASRLEGLSKELGFAVVVSATARSHLSEWSDFVDLGEHALKGRAPMAIFGWKPINLRNTP
jgi:adenylate cyclase